MFTFWPHPESTESQKRWLQGAPRGPAAGGESLASSGPAAKALGTEFPQPPRWPAPVLHSSARDFSSCPVWTLHAALWAIVPSYLVCCCCPEFALSPSHLSPVYFIGRTLRNQSARANTCVWNWKAETSTCHCVNLLNFQLSHSTGEGKTESFPALQGWCYVS